jgi:hypothetical protein
MKEKYEDLVALYEPITLLNPFNSRLTAYDSEKVNQRTEPPPLGKIKSLEDEIVLFRRVQSYKSVEPIATWEEAQANLRVDKNNASANQFMGWHALTIEKDPESAIRYLRTASRLHGTDRPTDPHYNMTRTDADA